MSDVKNQLALRTIVLNEDRTDYSGADLRWSTLISPRPPRGGWDFRGADLREAAFIGDFTHSNFTRANLSGTALWGDEDEQLRRRGDRFPFKFSIDPNFVLCMQGPGEQYEGLFGKRHSERFSKCQFTEAKMWGYDSDPVIKRAQRPNMDHVTSVDFGSWRGPQGGWAAPIELANHWLWRSLDAWEDIPLSDPRASEIEGHLRATLLAAVEVARPHDFLGVWGGVYESELPQGAFSIIHGALVALSASLHGDWRAVPTDILQRALDLEHDFGPENDGFFDIVERDDGTHLLCLNCLHLLQSDAVGEIRSSVAAHSPHRVLPTTGPDGPYTVGQVIKRHLERRLVDRRWLDPEDDYDRYGDAAMQRAWRFEPDELDNSNLLTHESYSWVADPARRESMEPIPTELITKNLSLVGSDIPFDPRWLQFEDDDALAPAVDASAAESKRKADEARIWAEFDALVGLAEVKAEVNRIIQTQRVDQERKRRSLPVSDYSRHLVMLGPPGTGKTTVARLLAEAYRQVGCLSKGHLIEVDSGDLIAEYVGQTAPKADAVIDSAIGGVLFIDEAYQLAAGASQVTGGGSFGAEAITTILKRMEDDRENLVVIVAGYEDEMNAFLGSNPGLASRFGETINFPSYSADELRQIATMMIADRGYAAGDAVVGQLVAHLESERERDAARFGNARSIRRLIEATQRQQAVRLGTSDLASLSDEALTTLLVDDIPSDS